MLVQLARFNDALVSLKICMRVGAFHGGETVFDPTTTEKHKNKYSS